jgi:hypothetical protein
MEIESIKIELRPLKRECVFHSVPPVKQVKVSGTWLDACPICVENYKKNYNNPNKDIRDVM